MTQEPEILDIEDFYGYFQICRVIQSTPATLYWRDEIHGGDLFGARFWEGLGECLNGLGVLLNRLSLGIQPLLT